MNTEFPYNKGGETLTEVIDGIWENLNVSDENLNVPGEKGARVMVLAKEGFDEICRHIAEWQKTHQE